MSNNTKPVDVSGRVGRGGSWISVASGCRAAVRLRYSPGIRGVNLGFRPVVKVSERDVKQH